MIYGYCIRRAGDPPPGDEIAGVAGAAVRLFEHARLGAWFSEVEAPRPSPERLREHDRVVRAALRTATPLPLRFGTVFSDTRALRATLNARRTEFADRLETVVGRVEMGVAILWDAERERERLIAARADLRETEKRPTSGREYLQGRGRALRLDTAMRARAEALVAEVERALGGDTALPTVRALLPRAGVAGSLAQLVPRDAVAAYRERAEALGVNVPALSPPLASLPRVALSGPWAPYSFV